MALLRIFKFTRWAVLSFVVLSGVAVYMYPGGTFRDHSTHGYSFFQNFFSDLGMTVAQDGEPTTWVRRSS